MLQIQECLHVISTALAITTDRLEPFTNQDLNFLPDVTENWAVRRIRVNHTLDQLKQFIVIPG
jgi:hypothetical protein